MPQTVPTPSTGTGSAASVVFDPLNLPTTIVSAIEVQTAIEELDTALVAVIVSASVKTFVTITVIDSPFSASGNQVVLADASGGPITVALPVAGTVTGQLIQINKTDNSANAVTIDGNGAETINGSLTETITTQHASAEVTSDGANWHITG